jgi:predicted nucleotide-binding protein
MEDINALQELERGEKPDQDTLLRLKQAGLIDIADASHLQSPGPEFIFVGFTANGLSLLKRSKSPLVSDAEREIILVVVRRFLDEHHPTSSRELLKKFKSPVSSLLYRLGSQAVLQLATNTYSQETYLPNAIAFYHCGDSAALAFARKSTVLVLRVLRDLFDKELEAAGNGQKQFAADEVEAAARAVDSSVEPDMIFTGLYLAQEFSVFTTIRRDEQQVGIVSFSLNERIYDAVQMDWDEHIRRSNISVARTLEQNHSEFESTMAPFSAAGLETYAMQLDNRKIFLVHGHADETKNTVAKFLRSLGLEVIILHEQANQGQTIVEKFEKHSDVGFAVVLLTPDDFGGSAKHPEKTQRRARQNVILELGIFIGKLGRERVCPLYVEGVELPSDIHGVLYVRYDQSGNWQSELRKELVAAGIAVDSKKPAAVTRNEKAVDAALKDVTMIARKGGPVEQLSEGVTRPTVAKRSGKEEMVFEESVYWKRMNGSREGPYCPVCYDDKQKVVHLNPGASRGTYGCGVCQNSFRTKEYNPRPVRRRPFSSR